MFHFTAQHSQLVFKIDQVKDGVIQGAQNGIEDTMQTIIADLAPGGDAVEYPIMWDTARQRRAFFASNGFGRGIPTERTGAIEHGFKVVPLGSAAIARAALRNEQPGAKYVYGDGAGEGQSSIHRGRWDNFHAVMIDYIHVFVSNIDEGIHAMIDSLRGGS